jgi:acetylcholinesterase
MSVALQMIGPDSGENKEDLFHSAFMQSGNVIPVGHIRDGQVRSFALPTARGNHIDAFIQKSYDFLVNETGCAKPKTDTLSCLRGLRYATLKAAVDKGPRFTDYQVR